MKSDKNHSKAIDDYIFLNKILCTLIGLWPFDEKTTTIQKIFAYFRISFALISAISIIVPEILAIYVKWGNIATLAGVGCILATVSQFLFKIIYILIRRKRISKLYDDVHIFWRLHDNFEDKKSYYDLANQARILTISFYICGIGANTIFITATVGIWIQASLSYNNNTNQLLPFEAWYGQDVLPSPVYEIIFITQIVASTICATGTCGLDTTMATLTLHICGQFTLIQARFRIIGQQIDHISLTDDTFSENLKLDIRKSILYHQRTICTAEDMNVLLSPIVFVMLLTCGLKICLTGYTVTSGVSNADLLKFITYLLSMVIQILICCYPAERLILESQQVMHSAYLDIPWYNLPSSYYQDFIMVICKAQRYCCIKAALFGTLSMSTLTNVFNTAASYFTLLRQMQQE